MFFVTGVPFKTLWIELKFYFILFFKEKPEACPPGSWSVQNSETCHDCPAGQQCPSVASSTNNRQCLPGKYSRIKIIN